MSGAVDIGFWIYFLLVGGMGGIAGWCARGMWEREKAEQLHRARMLHPSRRIGKMGRGEVKGQGRLW